MSSPFTSESAKNDFIGTQDLAREYAELDRRNNGHSPSYMLYHDRIVYAETGLLPPGQSPPQNMPGRNYAWSQPHGPTDDDVAQHFSQNTLGESHAWFRRDNLIGEHDVGQHQNMPGEDYAQSQADGPTEHEAWLSSILGSEYRSNPNDAWYDFPAIPNHPLVFPLPEDDPRREWPNPDNYVPPSEEYGSAALHAARVEGLKLLRQDSAGANAAQADETVGACGTADDPIVVDSDSDISDADQLDRHPSTAHVHRSKADMANRAAAKVGPRATLRPTANGAGPSDESDMSSSEFGDWRKLRCTCQTRYDPASAVIACDYVACPIRWFHLSCMGLDDVPSVEWYCPDHRVTETDSSRPYPYLAKLKSRSE